MTAGGGPPWWPQGESWPPPGPWRFGARRFRRRFLAAAVGLLLVLIGAGFTIGMLAKGERGGGGPPYQGRRGGPWGFFGFSTFVLVVGGGATALAYRRISRPVADLLGAADRLSQGDYRVRIEPDGPRELRTLTATFNEMAARLASSEEQRRRFLADVTHELRTPLAVLQSGIEAQIDGVHPRDDRHLASLLEETQILGRLVDDLHTLALADAGRLSLHRERAAADVLVEDAVDGHVAIAERRGVTIDAAVAEGLPELDVDPTRVRQVLTNLLSNAVRHSPDGGRVHVEVDATAEGVRFTVTDSGPGFPPEQLAHVFERFSRPADSRGSGLGLSIARNLVEAHGGSVGATNRPGGGAAVSFVLPAPS